MKLTDIQRTVVEDNMGLVGYCMNRFLYRGCADEDMRQAGCVALCRAAATFKPEKGNTFSTYAVFCIRNALYGELKKNLEKQERQSAVDLCSIPAQVEDEWSFIDAQLDLEIAEKNAQGMMKKGIIAMKLRSEGKTASEVAELFSTTPNNVTAWVSHARKMMKKTMTQNGERYAS